MSRYLLCRYEDNGYHDSYFYAAVWNHEAKKIEVEMEGATAFAGGKNIEHDGLLKEAPAAVRKAFRDFVCNASAEAIFSADEKNCYEPKEIRKGDKLVLIRKVSKRNEPSVPAGVEGSVFWSGCHRPVYQWKPGRDEIRVGLELKDDSKVFVPLSACRRDKEPEPLKKVAKRMKALYDSGDFNICPLVGCRAWLSESYI